MPKRTLIITDVTAMRGDNVCIAGYDSSLSCIRPVLSPGQVKKEHLFKEGNLIIFPGAKVVFNFGSQISQPPHVEDVIFDVTSVEYIGNTTANEWQELLKSTAQRRIADLFPHIKSRYVPPGSPGPSIGTMCPAEIPALYCDYYKDPPRPRMRVVDHEGCVIDRVPMTDLAFRGIFEDHRAKYGCEKAVELLNKILAGRKVYLRLGLTRPFPNAPEKYAGWCCLQINGIHTLPDLYGRDYTEWIRLE